MTEQARQAVAAPAAAPAQAAAPAAGQGDETEVAGWTWFDTAGVVAGGLLALIIVDIVTDGRISGWLFRRASIVAPDDTPQEDPGPASDD